jgi:hypothetical protein
LLRGFIRLKLPRNVVAHSFGNAWNRDCGNERNLIETPVQVGTKHLERVKVHLMMLGIVASQALLEGQELSQPCKHGFEYQVQRPFRAILQAYLRFY